MTRFYEMMVGGLGWTPGAFWRASAIEIFMAIEGHNAANRPSVEPMLSSEFQELCEEYPD